MQHTFWPTTSLLQSIPGLYDLKVASEMVHRLSAMMSHVLPETTVFALEQYSCLGVGPRMRKGRLSLLWLEKAPPVWLEI